MCVASQSDFFEGHKAPLDMYVQVRVFDVQKLNLLSLFQYLILEILIPQQKLDKCRKCLHVRDQLIKSFKDFFFPSKY